MRYVSTFSGIEAASVAWDCLGWEPMAFCEIDQFPSAVLAERYPGVPNLGDITKVDWRNFAKRSGKPDLLVGGSPCQSFSIAGTRTGLDGASGLMWEYVRAVRELRPRWILWENVPGALSSTHGEDFRCLLEALDGIGYGLAWRVLDAQFFGVAQRRRRVFLVGHLGERPPIEVLFERDGLRWDTPQSREKRKELAAAAGRGARRSGIAIQGSMIGRSDANGPQGSGIEQDGASYTLNCTDRHGVLAFAQNTRDEVRIQGDGTLSGALSANPGMKQTTYVCETANTNSNGLGVGESDVMSTLATAPTAAVAYALKLRHTGSENKGGGQGPLVQEDVSATLATNQDQTIFQPHAVAATQYGEEIVGTLTARFDSSPCADRGQNIICLGDDNAKASCDEEMAGSLKCGGSAPIAASPSMVVRRLTPTECERLQGFPDGWTKIPYKGKPADECPDGPRYKAIGNSMAVPVMRWIGERIDMFERGEMR